MQGCPESGNATFMGRKEEIISASEEETLHYAISLGQNASPGDVYALYGDLGAGKTVFARGIARGLGIDTDITSPTFTLMEMYIGRLPLYHFDLYRIRSGEEFEQLFFEEYWEGRGISVIEWPENAGDRLPLTMTKIHIIPLDESRRRISVEYPGD